MLSAVSANIVDLGQLRLPEMVLIQKSNFIFDDVFGD